MRRVSALFALSAVVCFTQEKAVQEPEYTNVYQRVNQETGVLEALERQTGSVDVHSRLFGFTPGTAVAIVIPGVRSPIRFPSSQKLDLVVKIDTAGQDPANFVLFHRLTSTKNSRQFAIAGVKNAGPKNKDQTHASEVPFSIAKYGQASLKVTPSSQLPVGEYVVAVRSPGQAPVYCFGID
jgi:hypothetical protein